MSDFNNGPSPATHGIGFVVEVRGRQPHALDRDLSALLQENYVVADLQRGVVAGDALQLPGTRTRTDKDDVRAAGIDPALMHNAKSGFDASFYRDARGHVVLAFTGTDEGRDWKHDFGQGLGLKDKQYDRAIHLGLKAKDALGDSVIFTGHSLGGGLAAAASLASDIPAVTFNAAGVHDDTLERYGLDRRRAQTRGRTGPDPHLPGQERTPGPPAGRQPPAEMGDAGRAGHRIELPDPDPLTFFERLVPGRMLRHRIDLHSIEAVIQAQDLAQLQVHERSPGCGPQTIGDAGGTSSRLLNDALGGLAPQRQLLGLENDERFFNATAGIAARAPGRTGAHRSSDRIHSRRQRVRGAGRPR